MVSSTLCHRLGADKSAARYIRIAPHLTIMWYEMHRESLTYAKLGSDTVLERFATAMLRRKAQPLISTSLGTV